MKIEVFLQFEYFNFSSIFSIILCPTLKSYEFFEYFRSIYLAIILDRILSTHMLIVSPSTKYWSSHARVLLSRFRRTCASHRTQVYCFLMCTTTFLTIIFFE
jgi:hypothetical protein